MSFDTPVKRRPATLKILAAGVAWRWLGTRRSAETLMAAVAARDEQSRMLAGMSLVGAGRRSFDMIEAKLRAGEAPAPALRLLADIDQPRARAVMERVIDEGPAELRGTAGECLELLDRIAASESGGK
jgi:hypothetical protein